MTRGGGGEAFGEVQRRLAADVDAALKRRPPAEAKLAGALRAVAPHCVALRASLAEALEVLVRRSSFDRQLYAGVIRALVEASDKRCSPLLRAALATDEAGGLAAISAACFSRDPGLATPLARAASGRHAHLAFAAEVARLARGESAGAHLGTIAPKIKESHRIALCVELFLPLTRAPALPGAVAGALAVLRDAERHLGRWLVLGQVATCAGDQQPLAEARTRSGIGPTSSRAAWSLVAWALDPSAPPPATRPTAELVARLSDRPSSDRDTTFLFRLADARAPAARGMLESLVRGLPLADEVAVRAARSLARDYGRDDLRAALSELAADPRREELRGLAAAALWDVGERPLAVQVAEDLSGSRALGTQVWSALVKSAISRPDGDVLSEARFRRVQWGWVE